MACIEVKSILSKAELIKAFSSMKLLNNLRPFGKRFLLEKIGSEEEQHLSSTGKQPKKFIRTRCFRTLFAYDTDISKDNWLLNEWARVEDAAHQCSAPISSLDRILVMRQGLITPTANAGTENATFSSVFHQWFIHLANFLERENTRRPPLDWQKYTKRNIPGWVKLPTGTQKR